MSKMVCLVILCQELCCKNPKVQMKNWTADQIFWCAAFRFVGGACFTFVLGALNKLDLGALEEEHDEGTC
jgi:hypothetical protein